MHTTCAPAYPTLAPPAYYPITLGNTERMTQADCALLQRRQHKATLFVLKLRTRLTAPGHPRATCSPEIIPAIAYNPSRHCGEAQGPASRRAWTTAPAPGRGLASTERQDQHRQCRRLENVKTRRSVQFLSKTVQCAWC